MSQLHRLKYIEIKEKSVELFFKISVIREREAVFQSSQMGSYFKEPRKSCTGAAELLLNVPGWVVG